MSDLYCGVCDEDFDADDDNTCPDCGERGSDFNAESEDGLSDVEADAMTLASAGWGTDEDYGCFDSGDEW